MKKALPLLFLFLTNFLSAQTEKGKQLIGGSADVSMSFQGTTSTFFMSFNPTFAIFAVNNFAIGGRYSFGINSRRAYDETHKEYRSITTFTTAIGPLAKFYFGKKQMKGFISANGSYLVSTTLRKGNVSNSNGFAAGGGIGMAYFFNEHIGLETAFYVQASGYKGVLPTTRGGISIGIFALLDKKKRD